MNVARCEAFYIQNFAHDMSENHLYGRPFSSLYNIMRKLIAPPPLEESYEYKSEDTAFFKNNSFFIIFFCFFMIRNSLMQSYR